MTIKEEHKEKLNIALSETEEALDWFANDEAFAALSEFKIKLLAILNY